MGAAKSALLKKLRDAGASPSGADPWEEKKKIWIADIQQLFATIQGWLADLSQEKLIKIETTKLELREEDLGPYDVPALEIRTLTRHPRTVKVLPRGMRIIGVVGTNPADRARKSQAAGRIDLVCGASRTILLRARKGAKTSWEMVRSGGGTIALDEETFIATLNELIE